MSLTDTNGSGMVMPVAPAYGNGGYGSGIFGGWGGDATWLIILFLFAMMGGWGNGFGGFGGGGSAMPYILNNSTDTSVQRGFDQASVMSGINSLNNAVTSGFGNVQTALCSGFAGVNAGVANGFAQAEIADNARQIANMQQSFNAQTAISGRLDNIAMNQQNCCCENRAAVADLKYAVATEACADRAAVSDALNSTLNAMNAGIQSIKDQMCQDKIDAKNEQISALQTQLTLANLAASQNAQTSQLLADNAAQTQAVENYIRPQVNPCYVVPNPYANYGNYGCGCGCSGAAF